jgi:hypothetical protein
VSLLRCPYLDHEDVDWWINSYNCTHNVHEQRESYLLKSLSSPPESMSRFVVFFLTVSSCLMFIKSLVCKKIDKLYNFDRELFQ